MQSVACLCCNPISCSISQSVIHSSHFADAPPRRMSRQSTCSAPTKLPSVPQPLERGELRQPELWQHRAEHPVKIRVDEEGQSGVCVCLWTVATGGRKGEGGIKSLSVNVACHFVPDYLPIAFPCVVDVVSAKILPTNTRSRAGSDVTARVVERPHLQFRGKLGVLAFEYLCAAGHGRHKFHQV
jgi:hypothetical protein